MPRWRSSSTTGWWIGAHDLLHARARRCRAPASRSPCRRCSGPRRRRRCACSPARAPSARRVSPSHSASSESSSPSRCLLDHDAPGAEALLDEERLERRARLRLVGGDDHALAGGQPVELEHDRVALDRRHPVLDGRRPARHVAVGTPAASMTSLANALEPSSCATSARRPEGGDAARGQQRRRGPSTSGASGPDDDEVDAPRRAAAADQRRRRRRRRRRAARASRAMPGVARRARGPRASCGERPQRADDRVLAPARADDEDLHALQRSR